MIIFTPPTGRLIALDGEVMQDAVDHLGQRAITEALDRGAREVLARIIEDCCEKHAEPLHRSIRFSIRAVVLPEKAYREEVEAAYHKGVTDGMRGRS